MSTATETTVWLSFDLGIRGDYEGLYAWLDGRDAQECGDALAVFTYPVTDSLVEEITADLQKHVTFDKRTRLYLIYRDRTSNKNKGTFLVGGRRVAPWAGFAQSTEARTDEEV